MANSNSNSPYDMRASLDELSTEAVQPGLMDLDTRSVADITRVLVDAQQSAQQAVGKMIPQLARVAEAVAARLARGGRLIYVGAGTSGRLAVLDAAECVPTFNTPPELVVGLLAGGQAALVNAIEGAEDDTRAAITDLEQLRVTAADAVIGLTASGRTPYVVSAVGHASGLGAYTAGIVNNRGSALAAVATDIIELDTGPEVIAGSTRLAAGTAQKIALNTLSTTVMVRLGKTFGPYMVDVRATNDKLKWRALGIVRGATGASEADAARMLAAAGGEIKTAVVALLAGCDVVEARKRLHAAGGKVRDALNGNA